MTGQLLSGRYKIICQLGEGGFGKTFLAEDQHLPGQQKCVVKQFKPLAKDAATLQIARRLFDTEAKTLYQLGTHPQIPQLFAYFEENQEFYLVQEYIEGNELSQELSSGKGKSEAEVIKLLGEILEILEFVQEKNVIHRDLNPHNLIRRKADRKLVLIDFGAVKQVTTQMLQKRGSNQTVAIGTPGYISGEQAMGRPQLSSDIYAVGMIGIQALTGCEPNQLASHAKTGEVDWQKLVKVSPGLADLLDSMIAYDFRERYESATEALQAIKNLTHYSANSSGKTVVMQTAIPEASQRKQWQVRLPFKKGLIFLLLLALGAVISTAINYWLLSPNAGDLYQEGNTFYELKRYQDSLKSYEKALQIDPEYEVAWRGKGDVLQSLKRDRDSLEAYEKAIQIEPKDWQAWLGRAQVLEKLGKPEEAIDTYQGVIEIKQDAWQAWQGLANLQMKLQQYAEAVNSFDRFLRFKSDSSFAWYQRGWALQNLKEYKEAVRSYDRAIKLKIDFSQAWYQKGNALFNLEQYEEAVNSYEKAVQFQPSFSQAWYSQGIALSRLGSTEKALISYSKATQAKANYYDAWYQKAWTLHQLKRYAEAVNAYEQAIKLKPTNYQAWYNRGNALYKLADYQEALISYQKTLQFNKNYYPAWNSQGNTLVKLKRYQDAIAAYDRALRYKLDYPEAEQGKEYAQRSLLLEQQKSKQKSNLLLQS